jgi:citrate synthase
LAPDNVAQTGARILQRLTQALTRSSILTTTIASSLSEAWHAEPARLVDAALILCADHELNASSFTARVIASAEATPYAVVMGGLAALTGFRHGGQTRRVAAFLREIEQAESTRAAVRARLQRGDEIPGFGHRLYAAGDPRGALLLSLLEQSGVNAASIAFSRNVIEEVRQVTGRAPTIDFALVTLERALRLPPDSALALFGLGRTAGWIAHAIEQYATGQLIRPRARYTGRQPSDG